MSSASVCPNNEQKMDTMQFFLHTVPIFLLLKKNVHWKILGVCENMKYFSLAAAKFVQANGTQVGPEEDWIK